MMSFFGVLTNAAATRLRSGGWQPDGGVSCLNSQVGRVFHTGFVHPDYRGANIRIAFLVRHRSDGLFEVIRETKWSVFSGDRRPWCSDAEVDYPHGSNVFDDFDLAEEAALDLAAWTLQQGRTFTWDGQPW